MNVRIRPYETIMPAWREFVEQEKLSPSQEQQYATYFDLLIHENELVNLTAITNPADVLALHFQDSLHIDRFISFEKLKGVVDVGTGGGLPGIPLAIKYPDVPFFLIEVNKKKLEFLATVMVELELHNVTLMDYDWRTFLRKTTLPIDLFLSRASLHPDELIRVFRANCPYNKATLIYWASKHWKLGSKEAPYFRQEIRYEVQGKQRRYVFFDQSQKKEHGE